MKTTYKTLMEKTILVDDVDKFYIAMLMARAKRADKYWHECIKTKEPYCYGRSNVYLNLYYAESGWFKMHHTWIPNGVWKVPNLAFQKLLKLKGIL